MVMGAEKREMATSEGQHESLDSKRVGLRIAAARRNVRLTQVEAAQQIGISSASLARYEQGRSAKLATLQVIADGLGVPLAYLLDTEGEVDEVKVYLDRLEPLIRAMSPRARRLLMDSAKMLSTS